MVARTTTCKALPALHPLEFRAPTLMLFVEVPDPVGVPLITPVLVLKVKPLGSVPAFNRHPRMGGWDALSETEPELLRTKAGESGEPEVTTGGVVCAKSEEDTLNVARATREFCKKEMEISFMTNVLLGRRDHFARIF